MKELIVQDRTNVVVSNFINYLKELSNESKLKMLSNLDYFMNSDKIYSLSNLYPHELCYVTVKIEGHFCLFLELLSSLEKHGIYLIQEEDRKNYFSVEYSQDVLRLSSICRNYETLNFKKDSLSEKLDDAAVYETCLTDIYKFYANAIKDEKSKSKDKDFRIIGNNKFNGVVHTQNGQLTHISYIF